MSLKEILGEELYNKVTAALKGKGKDGKDVELLINDGTFIPKEKFDAVNTQKNDLTKQIGDLKKVTDEYEKLKPQIEAMKTAASENPLLKTQLEDLQKKIEAYPTQIKELQDKNTDWENKYKDTSLTNAIKMGLLSANVNPKFVDLLISKFDKSKLQLDNDKVIGLDDQIKSVQEGYKELFGEQVPPSNGNNPPAGGAGNVPKDESKMSDAEWWQYRTAEDKNKK